MTTRATPQEIMEFVNRLRVAGGFKPLDRLSGKAIPEEKECCLISCDVPESLVAPVDRVLDGPYGPWSMTSENEGVMQELKLIGPETGTIDGRKAFALPSHIALAAFDFDAYEINEYGERMEGDAE